MKKQLVSKKKKFNKSKNIKHSKKKINNMQGGVYNNGYIDRGDIFEKITDEIFNELETKDPLPFLLNVSYPYDDKGNYDANNLLATNQVTVNMSEPTIKNVIIMNQLLINVKIIVVFIKNMIMQQIV